MGTICTPGWIAALLAGVGAVLVATHFLPLAAHLAVAAVVALFYALMAIRDHDRLKASGASEHLVGAATARHMGLVWLWGAGVLLLSYLLLLPPWREWWHFFPIGFCAAFSGEGDAVGAAARTAATPE